MDIPDLIANSIRYAVVEAFTTMMNATVEPGEVLDTSAGAEASVPEPNEGVVSFIGLAGAWAGTGTIMCSAALACRICSQMLMTEAKSVDEEVLDAIAELTNIVIGSVKNDLEPCLGPLGLSIPSVIFGRNFKTKNAAHTEWVVERFRWDDEAFLVKLCLAPNERQPAGHTMGQTCPIEVKI
jgi:chemotaxis protein CheX